MALAPPVAGAPLPAAYFYVCCLLQGLLPYIVPLVVVYFAEYFINQGLVSEGCWGCGWKEPSRRGPQVSDHLPCPLFAAV